LFLSVKFDDMKHKMPHDAALAKERTENHAGGTGPENFAGEAGYDEETQDIFSGVNPFLVSISLDCLKWEGLNC
jgi:hypothetical protein